MNKISYKPIGIIHSPFKKPLGTPIQPTAAESICGTVEIFPEYAEGLKDIEGFSHIILLYHFHLSKRSQLLLKPFLDNKVHGVFAVRAPNRPNPIGISVVRLIGREGNLINICNVDIIDGTPLLDIKPYIPELDMRQVTKKGWLKGKVDKVKKTKDKKKKK